MRYYRDVLEAVGRTPLIQLSHVAEGLPVRLLAKAEMLNPGGSVKDRVGAAMIEEAERRGLLAPGGTIVEATAGNTGVGLALVAAVKGYRCIFALPDKMSEDKINLLKAYGAEVVITPTSVPPDSPESYNGVAERLAREIPGAFRPNQFANPMNPEAHYATTGPEIWEDSDGQVDVFVAAMGTGGTISGTGRFLKEKNPRIIVVGADPEGSILSGDSPRPYKVEGIGQDFVPATFDRQAVDEMIRVSDRDSFQMARRLAREEGLLVGGSAGTAVCAAVRYARRLPAGKTVVVLLPDTGRNYLTKFYSDEWLAANRLTAEIPERVTAGDVLAMRGGPSALLTVTPEEPAETAARAFHEHGISQLPVLEGNRVVGSVTEMTLVQLLHDGTDLSALPVRGIMGQPLPQVDAAVDVAEPYRLLLAGHGGVVVFREGKPLGILTRSDLVGFWNERMKSKQRS